MALDLISYDDKEATLTPEYPANKLVRAADINEIKAVTNAAVDVVNANIVSIPADYVPGFPGGSQQQLFQFMYAAIEGGGGGAATPTGDTITLTTADFGLNLFDVVDAGIHKRSALAQTSFTTDATSVEIALVSLMAQVNADYITDSKVSVFDASGAFVGAVTPTQASGVQLLTLSLPGSGVRRYSLVEGGNTRGNSNTEFIGTYVQQIRRLNGTSIVKVAPVRKPNRLIIKVDSIPLGDGSTNNSRYAWAKVLRDLLGPTWEVALSGHGGTYTGARLSTPELRQAEADRDIAYMAGATGRKAVLDADGTNAYGFSFDPDTDAAYKEDLWVRLHEGDPAIEIKAATPLWRGNMTTPNSIGKVLADYAAAYTAKASAHPEYVETVDCLPWAGAPEFTQPAGNGQTTDGLHPTDAGHAIIAGRWYEVITAVVAPPVATLEDVHYRDVAATVAATPGALEMVSPTVGTAEAPDTLFKGLARGNKAIAAGATGYHSFQIPVSGSDVFGGLGSGPAPVGYPDFKYALYRLSDGQVFAYEGTANVKVASTSANADTYQIGLEMVSGALAVVYRINNTIVRTVASPPAVAYFPVAALNVVGNKLTNAKIFSDAPLVTY